MSTAQQALRNQIIRKSKILIVDDARTDRLILQSFCNKAGFVNVEEATNGQEALEMIRRSPPDLIFLDIEMPIMDGLELCQALRDENLLPGIVVILQTANERLEVKAQAFEAGVTDLITKPLYARETIARALAHLERRYLSRQIEESYRHIRQDMEEAVILQNILLPHEEVIEAIRSDLAIDIAHYYHPASELAGDYISVRRLSNNRVALISLDISGHGLTAALYAFSIHSLLEDAFLSTHTPAQVLTMLNSKLHGFMSAGKFATAFIAVIDPAAKRIDYAAAASPPPIFLASGARHSLETRGHLLGIDDASRYEDHHVIYQAGDLLLIYSDALVESVNADGVTMQPDTILSTLKQAGHVSAGVHLRNVVDAFFTEYTHHTDDDLSMIACKL